MPAQYSRRHALKTAAAGLAAAPLLAAAAPRRPNIVFILSDDHRYDAMGFMDKPWLPTPNLDRLAAEGAHFTNSFVTTSLCSPSRASFLTGQYASVHGVKNNATPWRDQNVTFLELLHAAGYQTGFIGKWHMPGKGVPDLVGQGKIDRMVSFSAAGGQGLYRDCPLIVDGTKVKQKGYITDVLTEHALEFIDQTGAGPFCLQLSHKAVHAFFEPAERHKGALSGAPFPTLRPADKHLPQGAINGQQRLNFKRNIQGYFETLLGVDDSVGRVLAALEARGVADDTLIVYQGDNGYFWGEHGLTDKRYAYEEGIRVPHLLRYPRLIQGGGKVPAMVLNLDLAPTLLEAAGLPVPPRVQGQSYLGLAQGQDGPERSSFLYEYYSDPAFPNPPIEAVRTQDWKLITYPGRQRRFPDELYHLAADPTETTDLAPDPDAAEAKAELQAELERLKAEASALAN